MPLPEQERIRHGRPGLPIDPRGLRNAGQDSAPAPTGVGSIPVVLHVAHDPASPSQILNYAQFPGGPAATDGVVIAHSCFGTTGTARPPFHLGRTATYEIGRWLSLRPIWGDDGDTMLMFTAGQSLRMRAYLEGPRAPFLLGAMDPAQTAPLALGPSGNGGTRADTSALVSLDGEVDELRRQIASLRSLLDQIGAILDRVG
ncbi:MULTISPECIES: zinc metalloprotease [Rhodococcus]|uniref:hypothetical protein n=1 Tax=Rhodococcus TaxID=1827 RepID=UPI001E3B02F2|nr:hypothetical protein [Rhodococcus pyridinivorans]MCD2118622.1 hypothetical protein [Rhodococcus pyridinivorans]MCZ4627493.1 hypothetical protein [Rhodococcus pyridinivorans]MCZ4649099.1 hypothetical protein [Rhodococcus pyridinivorans]MDJ0483293.1 hypothetical protein [Rhodococcus pyridinivorans]MDV7254769.1 hypothetical protein [Rhodococcus pyridinivorans]